MVVSWHWFVDLEIVKNNWEVQLTQILLFGCEFKDKLPLGSFTMIDHMHAWLCLILKHYIHSVDPFTGLGPTDLTLHKFSVRNSYLAIIMELNLSSIITVLPAKRVHFRKF